MQAAIPDHQLPENFELFHNMVENARDGINITQNGDFKYVNKAFCDMLGYTREEMCCLTTSDLLASTDKQRMMEQHFLRMQGIGKYGIDYTTLLHKNGSEVEIEFNVTPITYQGENASFISTRDITERKRMQEKLEQSEYKYRTLIEKSLDGIVISQDVKVIMVNKAFAEMLGFTVEECMENFGPHLIVPEDRERVMNHHLQRMKGDMSDKKYTLSMFHKNGDRIITEFSSTAIEIDGRPASLITSRDITSRIKMQETLENSERKFRELADLLPQIIYELDIDGYVTYVNKTGREAFGMKEGDLKPHASDAVIPEERIRMKENVRNALLGKRQTLFNEYTALRIDGTTFPAIIYAAPMVENTQIIGLRCLIVDISERKVMENALRESEKKYRELAEMLPQAVYEHDLKGNLTYLNQAGKLKFGIDKLEPSISAFSLVKAEDIERMTSNMHKTLSENSPSHGNLYTALRPNGEQFPVMIFATPMISEGKKIGTRGILIDMTEHVDMENALRKSERKFRELADLLPQTVFEFSPQGFVTYFNKAGRHAYGFDENETSFNAIEGISPEDRERMRDILQQAIQEKRSNISAEYTARRKDGSTFPVIFYGTPMFENDIYVGSRGLVIDISERKAMEETLRKSEEHYRQVIQSLQEGLFVLQDDKFVFVNDAIVNILGYTVEEMTGKPFWVVIPPERIEEITRHNNARKEGKKGSSSYEFSLLHKDGKTRIPVILSTNLTDFDGSPAIVGTAKDITDRIKAEEEIKAAHKRLEEINQDLEQTIRERTKELTKANTQLLKLQKENLQSQFDVLKQQVNPHFLFNSLNVLTSLIRLEPELAEKFTEHLAKVYRYVLENKDNELVNLSTEINFLDAYIFLINIRFMDKVVVNIRIPDDKKNHRVIPLAMQLLIEKAIKHNAMSKKSPLVIDIFIDEKNQLNVVNNLQEREAHMTSTGVGLKNIQNRYRLLNNTVPVFEKSETHFIARIPLVAE
jgi:PAS domain S-box-containing protein